ncbi:IncP-type conjugal transfer protein TraG [Hyphococcus sp.]|uniref:IncP-type conjugal transfer protein TraG n=1 Tax=Hyphococcus sp. TaxID=2038636 RepID=UPI003CCBAF4E
MTPTKILIGQIIVVLAVVIGAVWGATQWAAATLNNDPWLGRPWFFLGDLRVFHPWRLFQWWYAYEAYAPAVFNKAGAMAAAGGFLGAGTAVAGSVWRARQSKDVTTYGSSRWATRKEIIKARYHKSAGVFLGRYEQNYLRHDGPEHVIAFAPTRSGKGVGLVVPTLLSWPGGAVIHDIKGENWDLTSGWRSGFSNCVRFDPTDPQTARFNPLLEVRRGANEVRDAQNIADILVDPDGPYLRRDHWDKTAYALLVGAILHVLYAEENKSLAQVVSLLSDPNHSFDETIDRMAGTNHVGTEDAPKTHPVIAEFVQEVKNRTSNERSGVLSTALSFLSLYRDPLVANTTSACDFRIADLRDEQRPLSLYLVVPPSDISRTKPLMRLILNQIGRRLTEHHGAAHAGQRVLLMLDEFPALGKLDFFESALAFMAGYGVRAFLIAQSLNQIENAYGPNHSILDNAHVRVSFATNDERTAKRVSDMLGSATEMRAMRNYAGHRLAPWLAHVMVSRQETQRPLLTPGEIMQLPPDDELVMISGLPPIRAKKLKYYEDRNFTERTLPAQEAPKINEAPAKHDWVGVKASVHLDLLETARQSWKSDDDIERDRAYGKPFRTKCRDDRKSGERLTDDDSPEIAAKAMAQKSKGLSPAQRAYGVERGGDLDLIGGR